MTRPHRILLLGALALLLPQLALAAGASEAFTRTTILLVLLITLADVCGFLFERMGLPEILGEIYAGILLGNLHLVGLDWDIAGQLRDSEFMQYSSDLAVVLLLFLVGLETNASSLLKVGRDATLVAATGVLLPVLLGLGAAILLGFGMSLQSWFIGAMLAATSVGITAKFLDERGLIHSRTARVILGAAVIDDVLGILLLAVLASVATSGGFSATDLLWIVAKALGFFAGAILVGRIVLPEIIHLTALAKHSSFWTGFALCTALGFAQVANFAGLAPLIGAFVAGLLLDEVHFVVEGISKHRMEELLRPITDILLTIFFVGIGSQVQLETLADPHLLAVVALLSAVAILSKGLVGFTARSDGYDRLAIGLGMIPRGEVGLVFATFAFGYGIFDAGTYSALVMVVLVSTMAGPLLLKSRLRHL